MSKLSDINEVGVISGSFKPKENPYATKLCFWCNERNVVRGVSCARCASSGTSQDTENALRSNENYREYMKSE